MTYSSKFGLRAGLVSAMVLGALVANADVKMTSQVTVATPQGQRVITVVTFIKGSLVRVDTGTVRRITDGRSHKLVILNTAKRNYFIQDAAAVQKVAAADIKKQHMQITAHIKPTGKKKMIAGRSAQQFVGDLVVKGDFRPGTKAEAKLKIDEWTTQASGVTIAQSDMMGTIGDILRGVSGAGGMQQVTKELSKIKGVPMNVNVTGTMTVFTSSGGAPVTQNLSYVTEALTYTEGPLPASAFQIPAGYTKIDPKTAAAKPKPKPKG